MNFGFHVNHRFIISNFQVTGVVFQPYFGILSIGTSFVNLESEIANSSWNVFSIPKISSIAKEDFWFVSSKVINIELLSFRYTASNVKLSKSSFS